MAELAAVYLITGTDRPKVTRALRRLRERVGEDATETLSALDAHADDVVAACNALGLFAVERRLVVVENVERWKAADLKGLEDYFRRPAPTTVLALTGEEIKRDSALAKAVAKAGEVLAYDLPKRGRKADLPRWVEAQLAERGVRIDADAARALVELVGENTQELATEIDKLATWAAGERLTEREIAELRPGQSRDTAVRPDRRLGQSRRRSRRRRERADRRALGRRAPRRPDARHGPARLARRPGPRVSRPRGAGRPTGGGRRTASSATASTSRSSTNRRTTSRTRSSTTRSSGSHSSTPR